MDGILRKGRVGEGEPCHGWVVLNHQSSVNLESSGVSANKGTHSQTSQCLQWGVGSVWRTSTTSSEQHLTQVKSKKLAFPFKMTFDRTCSDADVNTEEDTGLTVREK